MPILVTELGADLQATKEWRVAQDNIKPPGGENFREGQRPVEKAALESGLANEARQLRVRTAPLALAMRNVSVVSGVPEGDGNG